MHAYYAIVWLQVAFSPESARSWVASVIKMQIVYLRLYCRSRHTEVRRPYIQGWSKFPAWSSLEGLWYREDSVVKWKPPLPPSSEIRILSHVLRNKSSLFGCQKLHSMPSLFHVFPPPHCYFFFSIFSSFFFQGPDYLPEVGVLRVRKKWQQIIPLLSPCCLRSSVSSLP